MIIHGQPDAQALADTEAALTTEVEAAGGKVLDLREFAYTNPHSGSRKLGATARVAIPRGAHFGTHGHTLIMR